MKDVNILTNNGVNVAQSLELFGDMEMYDETLQDFLNMINEKVASLEKYKTTSDMANYAIEVHSLKSDARYLGFTALADMSYESELKSKAGDVTFVQENHPKIIAETNRMISVAKQYLGMIPVQAPTQPAAQQAPVAAAPAPAATPQQVVTQPQVQQVAQPAAQPAVQQAPVAQPVVQQVVQQPVVASQPAAQPVAAQPMVQPVQQPQVQPVAQPAAQPAAPAPVEAAKPTIEFFPAEPTIQFFPTNTPDTTQAATPASAFTDPMNGGAGSGKKGTLLIVDDSSLVAKFVKKIFETNYDVVSCSDGAEAIQYVDNEENRKSIKAVLLDLNMPNVDGFAVLEHFKQNGYFVKIPVAVESGVEDMGSIDKANQYPIVDVLAKPFNERDIQRVMEKCLATYF